MAFTASFSKRVWKCVFVCKCVRVVGLAEHVIFRGKWAALVEPAAYKYTKTNVEARRHTHTHTAAEQTVDCALIELIRLFDLSPFNILIFYHLTISLPHSHFSFSCLHRLTLNDSLRAFFHPPLLISHSFRWRYCLSPLLLFFVRVSQGPFEYYVSNEYNTRHIHQTTPTPAS